MKIKIRHISMVMICLVALVNMGTVRKKHSAIMQTQTDPIRYEDKMEEIKDGEKGAPTPSYKWYVKDRFLAETSFLADKEVKERVREFGIPDAGSQIPEDLSGTEDDPFSDFWGDDDLWGDSSDTSSDSTKESAAEDEDWAKDWWDEI